MQLKVNQGKSLTEGEKNIIIKQLALGYKDYEFYFVFRIPPTIIGAVMEFVDEALKKDYQNVDARICFLGLNRFKKKAQNISFATDSIRLADLSKDRSCMLTLVYFKLVFAGYLYEFHVSMHTYPIGVKLAVLDKEKSIFLFECIKFNIDHGIPERGPNSLNIYFGLIEQYKSVTPFDHPHLVEVYFGTVEYLIRTGGFSKDVILSYYQKGLETIEKFTLDLEIFNDLIQQRLEATQSDLIVNGYLNK